MTFTNNFNPAPLPTGSQVQQLAAAHTLPAKQGYFDELRGTTFNGVNFATNTIANQPYFTSAWDTFFDGMGESGFLQLNQRANDIAQQIQNNGVTYNVYSGTQIDTNNGAALDSQRPWALDLFPCLISAQEWQTIETGVIQRAKVLEAMMVDAYGPQQLLKQALLPAALTQGHPGYLRAMYGARPAGGRFLHIAAFDLARGPTGQWWVVAQRTQAPSGLGYLLENRSIISRTFPTAFQNLHVSALAATYENLVNNMRALCPAGANAHIALLTPGPYNETYFEHAYLARQLGLTLVEGSDLTVRNQKLYLKTLHGLEPVHGLLKRLDDEFLDPLEMRADSSLGVPGILQAIRAGNLLMANAPGSAFLESPALLGFMPGIAEHVLGEKLSLPAVPTWWCGERAALDAVLPYLGDSVIKPTYPGYANPGNFDPVLGKFMSTDERDAWAGRMLRQGHAFTVQQHLAMSQMPTWTNGQIVPKSAMLRVFAVSDGADAWQVLPGGLMRIAQGTQEMASMQRGASSADVWVSSGLGSASSAGSASFESSPPLPSKAAITSRSAESLFWLGRYSERAECTLQTAQLILSHINLMDVLQKPLHRWFYAIAVQNSLVNPSVPSLAQSPRVFKRALIAALSQTDKSYSLGFNLKALRNAAFGVRERLSQQQWDLILQTEQHFLQASQQMTQQQSLQSSDSNDTGDILTLLAATNISMCAITGAQTDRMARDDGWRLLSIGRLLERLRFLSSALLAGFEQSALCPYLSPASSQFQNNLEASSSFATEDQQDGFRAMLTLFDSTIPFRAQHHGREDLATLCASLILDNDNPRSLAWVAHTLRGRLAKLEGDQPLAFCALASSLPDPKNWQLQALLTLDAQGSPSQLLQVLRECASGANAVAQAISDKYFTHTHSQTQSFGNALGHTTYVA